MPLSFIMPEPVTPTRMPKKRIWARAFSLSTILGMLVLLMLSTARGAEPTTNLKVGYLSIAAGHSVLWVTKGAGLFEKNGLSVETIYAPSSALTQAMLARSIPLGISGPVSPRSEPQRCGFCDSRNLTKNSDSGLFGEPQEDYQCPTAAREKAWSGPVRERHRQSFGHDA